MTDVSGSIGASRPATEDPNEPSASGWLGSDAQPVGERSETRHEYLVPRAHADDIPEPGQKPSVTTSDLSRDDRYPAYGAVAAAAGVRAQVAVVLFDTPQARGVLNLYSLRAGAFDDTAVLTDLFAHHSATALAYATEFRDREISMVERRAVGQALGIVMERFTLSEAEAFALLQRTAEHRAVSVRLVAQELVARAEGASSLQ